MAAETENNEKQENSNFDSDSWEPRILGFLCRWCSYAGADLAGTSRLHYPANIRIIRVPCSGRVDPLFILKAFQTGGVDGVLVAGCHPGECHYTEGNYYTRRRLTVLGKLLEYIGIHPKRFRLEWVSASEGPKFAKLVDEMRADLKTVGPYQTPATWFGGKVVNKGVENGRREVA